MARCIAQSGLAGACLPSFFIRDDLRDAVLRPLLPQWKSPAHGVYLLYPQARKANPRVWMVAEKWGLALRFMFFDAR